MKSNQSIPSVVIAVGLMSLFLNMSLTIVFSYFNIYQHDVLHLNLSQIGFLEGVVNYLSYIMKLFSGYFSDLIGNRKILIMSGVILVLISRPIESSCTSVMPLFIGRTIERLGNGLQSTPRDALVQDWANKENHHRCFGLKAAMAYSGSIIGALLASILFYYFRDFQKVFWCSCLPAIISLFIVIFFVKNKPNDNNKIVNRNIHKKTKSRKINRSKIKIKDIKNLSAKYWTLLAISILYAMAQVSESMCFIYIKNTRDIDVWIIPLFYAIFNIGNSMSCYLCGIIANKLKRIESIFVFGIMILIISDVLFILCQANLFMATIAMLLLGVYLGIANSTIVSSISNTLPKELIGTGLGVYNFTVALAILFSNTLFGIIAEKKPSITTFCVSIIMASIALIVMLIYQEVKYMNWKYVM